MRRYLAVMSLSASLFACGTTSNRGNLPVDNGLRGALVGPFHGYWTGATNGVALKAKDGRLLEVPVVLDADLTRDIHWAMDATDIGELMLESADHYNSSVWFVATEIEVQGSRIYITKNEGRYEDTLCLELVNVDAEGSMRFQARAFLADPGKGERTQCLAGSARYDATLLLLRGASDLPEFKESGRDDAGPQHFGAEPPGGGFDIDNGGEDTEEGEDL